MSPNIPLQWLLLLQVIFVYLTFNIVYLQLYFIALFCNMLRALVHCPLSHCNVLHWNEYLSTVQSSYRSVYQMHIQLHFIALNCTEIKEALFHCNPNIKVFTNCTRTLFFVIVLLCNTLLWSVVYHCTFLHWRIIFIVL